MAYAADSGASSTPAAPRAAPSAARQRLRRFRVPVLVLALLGGIAAVGGVNALVAPVPWLALPVGLGLGAAGVVFYHWLSRTVELRPAVPELAKTRMWSLTGRGVLLGIGLFTTMILLIGVFGGWQEVSWGSFGGLMVGAGMMAGVAVAEETLFRGVVFRILEERFGTVASLVVSSLLFGAIHLVNADATLWSTLAIALTGGTLLAAAYVATRSLWLPIGLHFAWNFSLRGIFGSAQTGAGSPSGLLDVALSGPTLLTGGGAGPEASLFALLVCSVPTALFLRRAARTGRILRPAHPMTGAFTFRRGGGAA